MTRKGGRTGSVAVLSALLLSISHAATARPAFTCGGFALLGGAQLVCSHTDPEAPTQICTFSWALSKTGGGESVVEGSFLLTPGMSNFTVYQGSGFSYALSNPIILCQGKRSS